jgi:hypothetical protein
MKYLAFTAEDQGIILEASDWDDVKLQLKRKLAKDSLSREIKVVNLVDATEKKFIPGINHTGGAPTSDLHSIAAKMNDATKNLVDYIEYNKQDGIVEDTINTIDTKKFLTKGHPECSIM